ncbi:MAG: hypothetical protein KJZ58_12950 [Flavobacteriales bacterium]|jgi:Flp pilus assembly protein TadB|nr:hypothetical protein [Flavobacteriales bacterium]MCL4283156.1 hypothetical protein [Flavobacteriales bacterium]
MTALRILLRFLAVLLLALFALSPARAQEGIGKKQQEKIQRKKEKDDKKEVEKEEKRLYKRHLENQDKATRKRMKRNQRRAVKQGQAGHRDPFLRRLFGTRH